MIPRDVEARLAIIEDLIREGGGSPDPGAVATIQLVTNELRMTFADDGYIREKLTSIFSQSKNLYSRRANDYPTGPNYVRQLIRNDIQRVRSALENP